MDVTPIQYCEVDLGEMQAILPCGRTRFSAKNWPGRFAPAVRELSDPSQPNNLPGNPLMRLERTAAIKLSPVFRANIGKSFKVSITGGESEIFLPGERGQHHINLR